MTKAWPPLMIQVRFYTVPRHFRLDWKQFYCVFYNKKSCRILKIEVFYFYNNSWENELKKNRTHKPIYKNRSNPNHSKRQTTEQNGRSFAKQACRSQTEEMLYWLNRHFQEPSRNGGVAFVSPRRKPKKKRKGEKPPLPYTNGRSSADFKRAQYLRKNKYEKGLRRERTRSKYGSIGWNYILNYLHISKSTFNTDA